MTYDEAQYDEQTSSLRRAEEERCKRKLEREATIKAEQQRRQNPRIIQSTLEDMAKLKEDELIIFKTKRGHHGGKGIDTIFGIVQGMGKRSKYWLDEGRYGAEGLLLKDAYRLRKPLIVGNVPLPVFDRAQPARKGNDTWFPIRGIVEAYGETPVRIAQALRWHWQGMECYAKVIEEMKRPCIVQ